MSYNDIITDKIIVHNCEGIIKQYLLFGILDF